MATLAAQGKTQREIAAQTNHSLGTVNKYLNDAQIKTTIDQCQRRMVAYAPRVTDKFMQHVLDEDDKKISLDAIKHYHQIIGIQGAHTQSQFLIQVFNTQETGLQDAQFRSLAMSFLGLHDDGDAGPDPLSNPDIIDITPSNTNPQ